MTPTDLPGDEYEVRRKTRRDVAIRWISRLNRWWLFGQVATLGSLCGGFLLFGPDSWFAVLVMQAVWILSLAAAGSGAVVTFWNWPVLPGLWRAIGLAPWAVLLMEMTFVGLRLL